ncbi:MAG: riboflavin synthase [Euryarchaeota archaeon]|nr:riboflavin synthase [Euryarchaeota archaeon]|tara:strand:- start:17675 stop:18277 length:603 start_codon:yes stop_codon:yes gene_type:complete
MYTGIVAGVAPVSNIEQGDSVLKITIGLDGFDEGIKVGASVSLDGVCMTVVSINGSSVSFDAIEETLRRTTLGSLKKGDLVNVERSLKVGDELGGHILSGHVMSKARIIEKMERGEGLDLRIESPSGASPYILEKGFIAVDGMSLTVGEVSDNSFSLHIIPETIRSTTIGSKGEGDMVNIEIDSRTQAVIDTIRRMEVEG